MSDAQEQPEIAERPQPTTAQGEFFQEWSDFASRFDDYLSLFSNLDAQIQVWDAAQVSVNGDELIALKNDLGKQALTAVGQFLSQLEVKIG